MAPQINQNGSLRKTSASTNWDVKKENEIEQSPQWKSAAKLKPRAHAEDLYTPSSGTFLDPKQRRRDLIRARHRDILRSSSKPDPDSFHTTATKDRSPIRSPLNHFEPSSSTLPESDNHVPSQRTKNQFQHSKTVRQASFRSEKKSDDGSVEIEMQPANTAKEEMSTASTSSSNSSSSSSLEQRSNPILDTSMISSAAMDSDQELEQYSRQIRMELRQAEMLELASEALKAAEQGRKKFSGRASTFGDNSELDLPMGTPPPKKKATPVTRRRNLDFGTPLTRRPPKPEESKISVVALRDFAEVVPSFGEFHKHLRTHLARRGVTETTLLFDETEANLATSEKPPAASTRQSSAEQNMIHLLSSFNFGKWGSSNRSIADHKIEAKAGDIEKKDTIESKPSESSTGSAIGDLLAEHTPIRGSRSLRAPKVYVPPGLQLWNKETFAKKRKEQMTQEYSDGRIPPHTLDDSPTPSTPQQTRTTDAETLSTLSTTASPERDHLQRGSLLSKSRQVQDGSPNSPIIVDDLYEEEGTPERKTARNYRNRSPLPVLPVTPKDNFQDIFDSQFTTPKEPKQEGMVGAYLETPNDDDLRDTSGYDFDTPVRLRDIRDDHSFGNPNRASQMPRAPLLRRPRNSSSGGDQRGMPFDDFCIRDSGSIAQGNNSFTMTDGRSSWDVVNTRLSKRFDEMADSKTDAALLDATLDVTSDFSEHEVGEFNFLSRQKADPDGKYMPDNSGQIVQSMSMPVLDSPYPTFVPELDSIHKGYSYDIQQERRIRYSDKGRSLQPGKNNPRLDNEDGSRGDNLDRGRARSSGPDSSVIRDYNVSRVIKSQKNTHEVTKTDNWQNPKETSIIDMNGIEPSPLTPEAAAGDDSKQPKSKNTADFRCECLISPASSLESEDEDGVKVRGSRRSILQDYSAWNLLESPTDGNHQPLQAAVAMFSKISPTGGCNSQRKNFASSKENDDFMSNYLYCSKTQERPVPNPDPICAAPPCQDTQIPCGDIAVDTCVGNFFENALKFLPKKSAEGKKLLNLSRDKADNLQKKPHSWYDLANERFDGLLERLLGSQHTGADQWKTFQAPELREKKDHPLQPQESASHEEMQYDEDLGGIIYYSTSLDSTSRSSGGLMHAAVSEKLRNPQQDESTATDSADHQLRHALSDSDYHRGNIDAGADSSFVLGSRYSL